MSDVISKQVAWVIADHIGALINFDRMGRIILYDGKEILADGMDDSELMHEIAHFIVCQPRRRGIENYGLGGNDPDAKDQERRLTNKSCNREEELASILGVLLEAQLGANYKQTLLEHSWFASTVKETKRDITRCVTRLQRAGHLVGQVPLVLWELANRGAITLPENTNVFPSTLKQWAVFCGEACDSVG